MRREDRTARSIGAWLGIDQSRLLLMLGRQVMYDDSRIFPWRFLYDELSSELKAYAELECDRNGATLEELADDLRRSGLAAGDHSLVTRRVWKLLEGFNRSGNHRRVEHGSDGRYRQSRRQSRI